MRAHFVSRSSFFDGEGFDRRGVFGGEGGRRGVFGVGSSAERRASSSSSAWVRRGFRRSGAVDWRDGDGEGELDWWSTGAVDWSTERGR